jgi:hypothetical protein
MGEGVRGGVEASEAVYGIPAVIGEESIYGRSAGRRHCAQGLLRNYAETVTCSEMNGACRVSKKAALAILWLRSACLCDHELSAGDYESSTCVDTPNYRGARNHDRSAHRGGDIVESHVASPYILVHICWTT